MQCRFHHVALKAKDFDAAVNFYKDVLGLKEKIMWMMGDTPAIMLEMSCGGIVEIFGLGSDEEELSPRWVHMAVVVDDIPAVYKKAIEYGAKPLVEPDKMIIQGKEKALETEYAFIQGVAGEVFEFIDEKEVVN